MIGIKLTSPNNNLTCKGQQLTQKMLIGFKKKSICVCNKYTINKEIYKQQQKKHTTLAKKPID